MDFNLVKKCNKKLILWIGTISFGFLIVALIITFALTSIEIKTRAILGVQFLANNLLIWLLIVGINLSPTMIKFLFRIINYRHPQTKVLKKSEISLGKWTYFLILFLCLMIWVIEVSGFMFQTQNWISALKNYWWICFLMMIFNISLLYLNFAMAKYLYNHQPTIKEQITNN